ncbi:hypothetical protein Mal4_21480 [Maioricimonas rarisocia]|uniref:Uncharacterized protein n=1 Tax=Maioricimonas rarisocia TaxID=2528026 RepID=A0A517Z5W6_9PLAN|nr:hypothetical protein [Maioricimonas rarisocia]QDU37831.1 hypothetical protein Mal4_21480 [Maioricimonas rarisocia]
MNQDDLHVIERFPRCQRLLSKGLYLNSGLSDDERVAGDGNFWCADTQTAFGPDNSVCDGGRCSDPSRSCYRA